MNNKETVETLKVRIELLEESIKSFQRSIVWKLWHFIDRAVNTFLPKNTLRRARYDSLVEKNQILFNDDLIFGNVFNTHSKNKNTTIQPSRISTNNSISKFSESFPETSTPEVSIIVLSYNNVSFLHQCLYSIKKNTASSYELIIIDNNSDAPTQEFLKRLKGVKIIYNKKNEGFGRGCNQGAKVAKGRYILLLNNDTLVTINWLRHLVKTIKNLPDAGAVGGKIIGFNGLIQDAGGIITKKGAVKIRGVGKNPNLYEYSYFREVDHCTAACLLVRKTLFDSIGGFDERYSPAYYEDVDLSMSIKKRGYKIYYQPNSIVYHNQHTSSSTNKILILTSKNKALFRIKWERSLKKMNHV